MPGLTIAVDAAASLRFVDEVERGQRCACFCPTCSSPLVSKQGESNAWHFSHERGQERPECVAGLQNLFKRLLWEFLQHDQRSPVLKLVAEGRVRSVNWRTESGGAPTGALDLLDGRTVPLAAEVTTGPAGGRFSELTGVFRCELPDASQISNRLAAMDYIAEHARLRRSTKTSPRPAPAARRKPGAHGREHDHGVPHGPLDLELARDAFIKVFVMRDDTVWTFYRSRGGEFVLRQWPLPLPNWEQRFSRAAGVPRVDYGVYQVVDVLLASATLRAEARRVAECVDWGRIAAATGVSLTLRVKGHI